MASYIML